MGLAVYGVPSLDLSKATKLEDVELWMGGPDVRWIIMALQSVKSTTLHQITIHSHPTTDLTGETVRREWQGLDRLLAQLWTSHSVRPQITYKAEEGVKDLGDHAPSLLPELTRRGLVPVNTLSPFELEI